MVLALESLLSSEIEIVNNRREHRRQAFRQHVGALPELIVAVGTVGTRRLRRFDYDAVVFLCFHCRLNERCGSVVSEMDGEDGGVEMVCEVTAHSATVVELNERVLYIFSI